MCNINHNENRRRPDDQANARILWRAVKNYPHSNHKNHLLLAISLVNILLITSPARAMEVDSIIPYDWQGREGVGVNFINAVRLDMPKTSQLVSEYGGGSQDEYSGVSKRVITGTVSAQQSLPETSKTRLLSGGSSSIVAREQPIAIAAAQAEVDRIPLNGTNKLEHNASAHDRTETIGVDFVSGSPYALIMAVFGLLALIFVARRA